MKKTILLFIWEKALPSSMKLFKNIFSFVSSSLMKWFGKKIHKSKLFVNAKYELENWFELNRDNPKAHFTILLALKTYLSETKIKKQIENKRARINPKQFTNTSSFTHENKIILRKFYSTKTIYPGPEDFLVLEKAINKDKNKISAWLNNCRLREKNSLN